jgi:hypothetical protein
MLENGHLQVNYRDEKGQLISHEYFIRDNDKVIYRINQSSDFFDEELEKMVYFWNGIYHYYPDEDIIVKCFF